MDHASESMLHVTATQKAKYNEFIERVCCDDRCEGAGLFAILSKGAYNFKTPSAINIVGSYPCLAVQIVTKHVPSLGALVLFADLGCTRLRCGGGGAEEKFRA